MRIALACLFATVGTGCVSNWGQNVNIPKQFEFLPYWPDCDGDGWGGLGEGSYQGALLEGATCLEVIDQDLPACPDGAGEWVDNGFDCDDAYAGSGSRVGPACPADYSAFLGEEVGADDYAVLAAVGREFLIWQGHPVDAEVAKSICRDWSGVAPGAPIEDDEVAAWWGAREALPVGVPGVVGMPESSQELQPLVDQVELWAPDEPWRGWVDLTFAETGQWVFTSTGQAPQALSFCDGQVKTPTEIYEGLIAGAESDEFLTEIHAAVRPVLRVDGVGLPCLEAPNVLCEGGEVPCRPEAEVLCERPLQVPRDREVYRLGDLECVQVET